ncbi:MAG: NrfD/PsrC family molybdoenzyme membrane anchor subunit [Planctomycetota bacterium]
MTSLRDPSLADAALLRPVLRTGTSFYVVGGCLAAVQVWAIYAWITQVQRGLGVTGMNRPVFWGLYITNFVFFIGISHAGTLISAILRLCKAEWRRPITRAAETITVIVLFIGMGNILLDIGRPDRALFVLRHGRLQSPLLWDVCCVSVYFTASVTYLYLPLIPDFAILRDTAMKRVWLYRILALGWQGTPTQQRRLNRLIAIMAIAVIPIAISVHTVVSYVFSMTVQPMWHSAIFGPYFVVGAIFSGIAALIVALAILRKVYHLEDYLKPIHFSNLGLLLLVMSLLWLYFTFCEYLTVFYGGEPSHLSIYYSKMTGEFSPAFWAMVVSCFGIPFLLLCNKKTRTILGTVVSSLFICVGMWLERFTIVVPTLSRPRLPYPVGEYAPSWVEWSLTAGCFAFLGLAYMVLSKLFPIVSLWEVREGRIEALDGTRERLREYYPGVRPSRRRSAEVQA